MASMPRATSGLLGINKVRLATPRGGASRNFQALSIFGRAGWKPVKTAEEANMSRGMPSMTALLGMLALAGYQNRDKLAEQLPGTGKGGRRTSCSTHKQHTTA